MPLSQLRRPLVLALLLYMGLLCLLRQRGFFRVEPPPEWRPFWLAPEVSVEGTLASGLAPKRAGPRGWLLADAAQGSYAPGRRESARPVRVLAYLPPGSAALPGQRLRVTGRLRRPRPALVPGEFDEAAFLEDRGACLVLHGRRLEVLESRVPWRWRPEAWAEGFHQSVARHLRRRHSPERAALLEGLLLGYLGPVPAELRRAAQDAGVIHLLVPSGAKVACVLAGTMAAGLWLGLGPRARLILAALAGGFYTLAVGAEPPYTRAYWAFLAAAWTRGAGRDSGPFAGLTLAALATLLAEPRSLFSAGFQMTYAAVLALLICMPRWRLPGRWPAGLRAGLSALLVSLAVQLALWPLLAGIFGRGSAVGLLANVLLVPASGFLMAAGFGAWALDLLPWEGAARLAAAASGGLAGLFADCCRIFAALPGAALDLAPLAPWEVAAFYLACLGLFLLPERRKAFAAWGAALVLAVGAWGEGRLHGPRVELWLLGSPRGSAALMRLPDGRALVLDQGLEPARMKGALRGLGVRRVDALWAPRADGRRLRRLADLGAAELLGAGPERAARWPGGMLLGRRGGWTLRHGRLAVEGGEGGARLRGREGDFCIMAAPSRRARPDCAPWRSLPLRRDGAARLQSDGETFEIRAWHRPGALRGALP